MPFFFPELFTSASAELFKVTGRRAFFEEVTILIPMAWNLSVEGSVDETFEEAEFRVAPSNPAYGHNPYTIQVKYTLLKLFFMLPYRTKHAESLGTTLT